MGHFTSWDSGFTLVGSFVFLFAICVHFLAKPDFKKSRTFPSIQTNLTGRFKGNVMHVLIRSQLFMIITPAFHLKWPTGHLTDFNNATLSPVGPRMPTWAQTVHQQVDPLNYLCVLSELKMNTQPWSQLPQRLSDSFPPRPVVCQNLKSLQALVSQRPGADRY